MGKIQPRFFTPLSTQAKGNLLLLLILLFCFFFKLRKIPSKKAFLHTNYSFQHCNCASFLKNTTQARRGSTQEAEMGGSLESRSSRPAGQQRETPISSKPQTKYIQNFSLVILLNTLARVLSSLLTMFATLSQYLQCISSIQFSSPNASSVNKVHPFWFQQFFIFSLSFWILVLSLRYWFLSILHIFIHLKCLQININMAQFKLY